MEKKECGCQVHKKSTPRSESEKEDLQKRLKKIQGQLNGIQKMLGEDRYCGDILIQLEASEAALKKVGYLILKTHMQTCVKEEIMKGNDEVIDETFDLIKNIQ